MVWVLGDPTVCQKEIVFRMILNSKATSEAHGCFIGGCHLRTFEAHGCFLAGCHHFGNCSLLRVRAVLTSELCASVVGKASAVTS